MNTGYGGWAAQDPLALEKAKPKENYITQIINTAL